MVSRRAAKRVLAVLIFLVFVGLASGIVFDMWVPFGLAFVALLVTVPVLLWLDAVNTPVEVVEDPRERRDPPEGNPPFFTGG